MFRSRWKSWLKRLAGKRPRQSHSVRLLAGEVLEERALLTAPVANSTVVITSEDKPLNGQLTGSDQENDPLTFSNGNFNTSHGKVTISSDGKFTYTPAINFNGTDSFTFVVNDGTSNSDPATVMVSVAPVNDLPFVVNGSASLNEDLAFPGGVATLATDVDNDTLTYSVVATTTHGTLTLKSADGTFTYTPAANYVGPDSFTFKASDSKGESNVGTYTLTVTNVDDPLTLTLATSTTQVARNNSLTRMDPSATLKDIDTVVNYANAQFRLTITGNTNGDAQFGRVNLGVLSQGQGAGLVYVSGSKVYFDNSSVPVATFSGGDYGRALVVSFTSSATETAVNAVLKQLGMFASKKAAVGTRTVTYSISAGGQKVVGNKTIQIN